MRRYIATLAAVGADLGNWLRLDRIVQRRAAVLACLLSVATTAHGHGPMPVDGIWTPESALHDPAAGLYLVSNTNGTVYVTDTGPHVT